MENPFGTTPPSFFYTQSNKGVSGPTLAQELWNWQPIKNWTRRLEILKIRKIEIYTKKIEIRVFLKAAKIQRKKLRPSILFLKMCDWQTLKVNNCQEVLIKKK